MYTYTGMCFYIERIPHGKMIQLLGMILFYQKKTTKKKCLHVTCFGGFVVNKIINLSILHAVKTTLKNILVRVLLRSL